MKSSTDPTEKNHHQNSSPHNFTDNKSFQIVAEQLDDLRLNRPTMAVETGRNEKTRRTVKKILESARDVFTQNGHAGLSLRKVADHAGVAVGNLTYHFPTKDSLLRSMLHEVLAEYADDHLAEFERNQGTPLDALMNIVEFHLSSTRSASRFFYQVWGFVGSDDKAKETIRKLYNPIGRFVYHLVRAANPKLNDTQIRRVVLQLLSLEEGYKLLISLGPEDSSAIRTAAQDVRVLTKRILFADDLADDPKTAPTT